MQIDPVQRTLRLSVGEFAAFSLGPRDGGNGGAGLWRAQLGTHWHQQLRLQAASIAATHAFEVPIAGELFHRGWRIYLQGRIDQIRTSEPAGETVLREIKTVTTDLPADEAELRAAYPEYFIQLATYLALWKADGPRPTGELIFVEAGSGLTQVVAAETAGDDSLFRNQIERVCDFLDLRRRAFDRLRNLAFAPAFAQLRAGQETALADLSAAIATAQSAILFEAPTGFGKTGIVLQAALEKLKSGHFERLLYLTSKSTGQLQVIRQLDNMVTRTPAPSEALREGRALAIWHVRNKGEHCVNHTFHCVREQCRFLDRAGDRWASSGLSRFYLLESQSRSLEDLRAAGSAAQICPYEITRTALAFNDVWVGDYNYVFAPGSRGLFAGQPGFEPGRTLLVIDEAHNLPARVADAYSHSFSAADALQVSLELERSRPPGRLSLVWEQWARFLRGLKVSEALALADEDDAKATIAELAGLISGAPLDYGTLGPALSEQLWRIVALNSELETQTLPRLWWVPRAGDLSLTCLDAAAAIGATLKEYGGVILVSATIGPVPAFAAACGLTPLQSRPVGAESCSARTREPTGQPPPAPKPLPEKLGTLNKRDTRKLYKQITSAASMLREQESTEAAAPILVRAHAPWRDNAYDVAYDVRVDTSYQQRTRFHPITAATVAALHKSAQGSDFPPHASRVTPASSAVFFPSYAYAEAVQRILEESDPLMKVRLQPRSGGGLAAQSDWVEQSLAEGSVLFLVLGSSFAESIDLLGGRVSQAMVVGPALPEVNAVQRARVAALPGAEDPFRRVYQIPGMTKVNQALGRLVRAPGQRAKVLLHCRRFVEPAYESLLAPEYRGGTVLGGDKELQSWLALAHRGFS